MKSAIMGFAVVTAALIFAPLVRTKLRKAYSGTVRPLAGNVASPRENSAYAVTRSSGAFGYSNSNGVRLQLKWPGTKTNLDRLPGGFYQSAQ